MKNKNVGIGSKNPVKIKATKEAFKKTWPEVNWNIVSFEVDSGVSDQPMSSEETIQGSRNRAKQVLKEKDLDFAVGMEGGISEFNGEYYNVAWIVVLDKNKKEGIGSTIGIKIPERIMKGIKEGKELGDVIDVVFNGKNLSKKEGYFGLMTKGLVDRKGGYINGTISALSRFIHDDLFE